MGKRQSLSEYADAGNVGYRIQDHDFRADEGRLGSKAGGCSAALAQLGPANRILCLQLIPLFSAGRDSVYPWFCAFLMASAKLRRAAYKSWHALAEPRCPKLCPLCAPTVPHDVIPRVRRTSSRSLEVQEKSGDERRELVALPGIEPGF